MSASIATLVTVTYVAFAPNGDINVAGEVNDTRYVAEIDAHDHSCIVVTICSEYADWRLYEAAEAHLRSLWAVKV